MFAAKSRDGSGEVLMGDGDFLASSKDGGRTWSPGCVFSLDESAEFARLPEPEAETLLRAARTSSSVGVDWNGVRCIS